MDSPVGSILIVGCGNMGGAMLAGWLAAGLAPGAFCVVDPVLAEAPAGIELLREVPARSFGVVLIGVKPQLLHEVAGDIAKAVGKDTVVFSILAGVELETLSSLFPAAKGIVRIMPNLAAAIGRSPMGLLERGLDEGAKTAVADLVAPLGSPEWLDDEALFDAVTALAGSGPAFVYRFIDALAQGAQALGLPAEQAGRLALATAEGAALLAAASPHTPGELARRVASPGGTTQAGLDVLDAGGSLARLVADTLKAAADRNAEMARAARR